jgi:Flp pilus assembly protein TadD
VNTENHIQRATLLLQQNRPQSAADSLRQALTIDPNHARAHALLGLCLAMDRDKLAEATREAEQAVHLSPADPYVHYLHSVVLDARELPDKALVAINESLQLDPTDPDAHGMRAHLLFQKRKYQDALNSAETGLQYDAEHQRCQAVRVIALERLGRVGDAVVEADRAVRLDPDSADAHAGRGWALLQKGEYRESQVAFREALRLNPGNEFARQGMMNAINSGNIVFRLMFRLMVKLSRLDPRVQWGLIIGMWVLMQLLGSLQKTMPGLAPFILPITIFYLLFVMLSWIIHPLFNTLLRFHPFGKFLLSGKEKWASNAIAGTLMFGIGAGIAGSIIQQDYFVAFMAILLGIYMTIPLSVPFNTEVTWATIVASLIASGFGLLYLANVGLFFFGLVSMNFLQIFTWGILIYCFASQILLKARPKL